MQASGSYSPCKKQACLRKVKTQHMRRGLSSQSARRIASQGKNSCRLQGSTYSISSPEEGRSQPPIRGHVREGFLGERKGAQPAVVNLIRRKKRFPADRGKTLRCGGKGKREKGVLDVGNKNPNYSHSLLARVSHRRRTGGSLEKIPGTQKKIESEKKPTRSGGELPSGPLEG